MRDEAGIGTPRPAAFRGELARALRERPESAWLTILRGTSEERFTVREMAARVCDYCSFYREAGIRDGDTVLIILKESLDMFASFFAGIVCGALPAYFAYPSPKQSRGAFLQSIDHLVRYNRIHLAVTFPEVLEALGERDPEGRVAAMFVDHRSVPARGAADLDRYPLPDREAFLQFSSGTTGAKKGVRISAEALFRQIEAYSGAVGFDSESRVVSWLPHYHDMGLIACMLMPFLRGVPVVMMSPFEWVKSPRILFDAVTKHRGTHVWLPNFALGHLAKTVQDKEIAHFDLRSLRQVVCCSEPVLHDTVSRFVGKFERAGLDPSALRNCYAMAENTFAMTTTRSGPIPFLEVDEEMFRKDGAVAAREGGRRIASAGHPLPNIRIRIADPEGRDRGEGRVGEILIRSDCMLDGYNNNPEETRKAFLDGWFRTGDLGFLLGGELYVTGRRKDIIIVGGENVYPEDIEAILNDDEDLFPGRNVAFGVEDGRVGTERIVVLAEAREGLEGSDTTRLKTKIFNAQNIPVSEMHLLPHMTLRKGTAGKISRHLNKLAFLEGEFRAAGRGPEDQVSLRDLVLGVLPGSPKPHVTEDTPLLSSGIVDSFAFTELVLSLNRAYGIDIPASLWKPENFQTLRDMERTIARVQEGLGEDAGPPPEEVLLRRGESLGRLKGTVPAPPGEAPWMERVINRFPVRSSRLYRVLFRLAGIRVGRDVRFLGRVRVKLRGRPGNIVIGDRVTLGDNVDLRNRENGRIVLKERVYLDHNVRIVAARDGLVEVGYGSEIGGNSVINSGGRTVIGEFVLVAGGVSINSSRHGTGIERFIKEQPHSHGTVEIGDDVWIGSGASVLVNTRIREGAVVASNSLVNGEIPPFAVCAGVPAKVIQYR